MEKRLILIYGLLFLLLCLDILTKYYFLDKNFSIIPGVLEISPAKNTGIAFGLFKGNIVFTIILPVLAILLLFYFFYKKKTTLASLGLVLTTSGLIGNLISRFVYGYVPDFITLPPLSFLFKIFNLADFFSFIGIILLVIYTAKER